MSKSTKQKKRKATKKKQIEAARKEVKKKKRLLKKARKKLRKSEKTVITKEIIAKALPTGVRIPITDNMLNIINNIGSDPDLAEEIKSNFLSHISVLSQGRFKLSSYINAVSFSTHKMMGDTDEKAYLKTFPDRYQKMIDSRKSKEAIGATVSSYTKTRLLALIYEQTMVPIYLVNRGVYQQAINVQADLMLTAKSELVRQKAADSIMGHLKPPETTQIDLTIGMSENSAIDDLRTITQQLAAQQRLAVQSGSMTADEVAKTPIVIEHEEE